MNNKQGIKNCPECDSQSGARKKHCKNCGYAFSFAHKIFKKQVGQSIDWTTLQKGDIIKVIGGSGPVMLINKEDKHGTVITTKESLGYSGTYRVLYLGKDGIHAYPVKANESGHCYIYMGKTFESENLVKTPHKIRLIKKYQGQQGEGV